MIAEKNVYLQHGHFDRAAYLLSLSKGYGVSLEMVRLMSCLVPADDSDRLNELLTDYVFFGKLPTNVG